MHIEDKAHLSRCARGGGWPWRRPGRPRGCGACFASRSSTRSSTSPTAYSMAMCYVDMIAAPTKTGYSYVYNVGKRFQAKLYVRPGVKRNLSSRASAKEAAADILLLAYGILPLPPSPDPSQGQAQDHQAQATARGQGSSAVAILSSGPAAVPTGHTRGPCGPGRWGLIPHQRSTKTRQGCR